MYKYWLSLAAPKLVSAVGIGVYKPASSVTCAGSTVPTFSLLSGFSADVGVPVAIDAPGALAVAQAAIANVGHSHEARAARISILLFLF
jgi:hypothetical protein